MSTKLEIILAMAILSLARADWSEQPDTTILVSSDSMKVGDSRFSRSQQYKLTFDGDIHMMQWTIDSDYPQGWYGVFVWSICSNQTGATFTLKYDGNLVLEDGAGARLWAHDRNKDGAASSPYYASVGDGGDLTEFSHDGLMIWNSSNPDTQNSGDNLAKFKYGDCLSVQF